MNYRTKQKILSHSIIVVVGLAISIIHSSSVSYAYTFGMLSHDDTITSIQNIEENHTMNIPMVSFIRDDYIAEAQHTISQLPVALGTGKIYHITLSPQSYTAQQVAQGKFDSKYKLLFSQIRQHNIKVIFRTMHEMNGGRYPWSSNPYQFKKARIRIYQLSRQVGLDQSQILFDFSTNGWDMPPLGGKPSQHATLQTCTPLQKQQSSCITWEDYYPGDAYVDMMGVSFYNRGKATSDRQWLTPKQIMEEPNFTILHRLKKKNKPIIIDEVGTTSVRYDQSYDRNTSVYHYESRSGQDRKNERLIQLTARAQSKPEIVALSYFNVDRTIGLAWENPGEADWSAIDLEHDRYYSSIMRLYQGGDQNLIKLFVTPEQKKKERPGIRNTKQIKKKTSSTTGSIMSSKSNTQ